MSTEVKSRQSKIITADMAVTTETLKNPQKGNHINLRKKEFLSVVKIKVTLRQRIEGEK